MKDVNTPWNLSILTADYVSLLSESLEENESIKTGYEMKQNYYSTSQRGCTSHARSITIAERFSGLGSGPYVWIARVMKSVQVSKGYKLH